jgi:ADP-ribose pyrophosphatase
MVKKGRLTWQGKFVDCFERAIKRNLKAGRAFQKGPHFSEKLRRLIPKSMKIIGKRILWEGKFLRSVLIRYSDSRAAGEMPVLRDWEAVERVNCDCVVAIVPLTSDGSVMVIRQFRPPINGYVVELPAGLCEPGEPPEDAAHRELREETGYSAGKMQFLTEGPLSSGLSSEMLSVFVATDLTLVGIGTRDETEHIEVLKIPQHKLQSRLLELRRAGNYIDLKIYGLVQLAKNIR